MNKVYLNIVVHEEGHLVIPAFAVRGLGHRPGDEVNLILPTDCCANDCAESQLLIKCVCGGFSGDGYTTEGDEINLPLQLLDRAGIPAGSNLSVLNSDGMLIIAAASGGHQTDLTDALGCLMAELDYDPDVVETVEAALPF